MIQIENISISDLKKLAENIYGDMIKAVADIQKNIVVVDAELHVDEEQYLLENGSRQNDLWGFNLYPDDYGTEEFIEFDSLINIRPSQDNRSRNVEDENIRRQIMVLVGEIVHE